MIFINNEATYHQSFNITAKLPKKIILKQPINNRKEIYYECIAFVVGTDSCQAHHLGVVQSGSLLVQHEDGSEETITVGDVYECKPGHQAQVVGDEPCVMIEFDASTAGDYAKD